MALKNPATVSLSAMASALRESNAELRLQNEALRAENHRLRTQVANARRKGTKF